MPFQWGGQLICDTGTNGLNQKGNPTGTSISSCDIQNLRCFQQLVMGFTLFSFFFCANTKIKITRMLSPSESSPSCFVPPGALGNRLTVLANLNGAVILFYGSCVPAGEAREGNPCATQQHPPAHLWAFSSVSELLLWQKWRQKWGLCHEVPSVPPESISRLNPHYSLQWDGLLCAQDSQLCWWLQPEALAVPGRADPKWFSFPRGWLLAQEPRNILHNIFWLLPVVTPRKCNLWIPRADFCLLWKIDGNAAFIQDCHQQILICYWYIERKHIKLQL